MKQQTIYHQKDNTNKKKLTLKSQNIRKGTNGNITKNYKIFDMSDKHVYYKNKRFANKVNFSIILLQLCKFFIFYNFIDIDIKNNIKYILNSAHDIQQYYNQIFNYINIDLKLLILINILINFNILYKIQHDY